MENYRSCESEHMPADQTWNSATTYHPSDYNPFRQKRWPTCQFGDTGPSCAKILESGTPLEQRSSLPQPQCKHQVPDACWKYGLAGGASRPWLCDDHPECESEMDCYLNNGVHIGKDIPICALKGVCKETKGDAILGAYGLTCVNALGMLKDHGNDNPCNFDIAKFVGKTSSSKLISEICPCSCASTNRSNNSIKDNVPSSYTLDYATKRTCDIPTIEKTNDNLKYFTSPEECSKAILEATNGQNNGLCKYGTPNKGPGPDVCNCTLHNGQTWRGQLCNIPPISGHCYGNYPRYITKYDNGARCYPPKGEPPHDWVKACGYPYTNERDRCKNKVGSGSANASFTDKYDGKTYPMFKCNYHEATGGLDGGSSPAKCNLDGGTPPLAPVLTPEEAKIWPHMLKGSKCVDSPVGWKSIRKKLPSGNHITCADFEKKKEICSQQPPYDYGTDKKTAKEACCACGGGNSTWNNSKEDFNPPISVAWTVRGNVTPANSLIYGTARIAKEKYGCNKPIDYSQAKNTWTGS